PERRTVEMVPVHVGQIDVVDVVAGQFCGLRIIPPTAPVTGTQNPWIAYDFVPSGLYEHSGVAEDGEFHCCLRRGSIRRSKADAHSAGRCLPFEKLRFVTHIQLMKDFVDSRVVGALSGMNQTRNLFVE